MAAPPKRPLPLQRVSYTASLNAGKTPKKVDLSESRPLPVHRLSGRVAIIVGGGNDIGIETAKRMLREGAKVSLVDDDVEGLESAVSALKSVLGTGEPVTSRILTIVADVSSEADVESYIKRTVQTFSKLDTCFLNYGVNIPSTGIFDIQEEDYERLMQMNVKSAFLGVKHAATAMRAAGNGGSIILTSSVAGLHGEPNFSLYAASKFALRGLALSAAEELGQYSIRVNTIHPSDIDTLMKRNPSSPDEIAELKEATPLGRLAKVDDIASVVAFLASEDSKFMTGSSLKIDGGRVGI
ncbi:NAD(P)-binding protein [Aaosphaeria arxii CBS 175.79]|uniref:NAD(P)-binding protein n=1 Tax=Aaosphaeria arxii CBS 175.79 TaxID=1450172 RepID=A0A6A5XPU1_9PLEO|nr:NAD(P)-binding protein [Aaosphaeria arxii CBS 175.79]KAF2014740.1 NAD(P)-binding protein [Aaosphaeria arxii CBS 175.79]